MIADHPDYLDRIVTDDETWVHYFDPLSKQQSELSKRKNKARTKKVHQQKSAGKAKGLHLPAPGAFEGEGECRVLSWCFANSSTPCQSEATRIEEFCYHLHYDNARSLIARILKEYLEANDIRIIPHPPYSTDLVSCDFWFFLLWRRASACAYSIRMKKWCKWCIFVSFHFLRPNLRKRSKLNGRRGSSEALTIEATFFFWKLWRVSTMETVRDELYLVCYSP